MILFFCYIIKVIRTVQNPGQLNNVDPLENVGIVIPEESNDELNAIDVL